MALTNYEITRNKMRKEFLNYNQDKMIAKYKLKNDPEYLYILFVKRLYRINRGTGVVEWSDDGFQTSFEADYDESMTIYDVLCWSKDDARLSGTYCPIEMLRGTVKSALPGSGMLQDTAESFNGHIPELEQACRQLGNIVDMSGDVAVLLHPFSFLPVMLQYWEGDDEFPAKLKFMFDENIVDFMHFETIYYMMSHILHRIRETANV